MKILVGLDGSSFSDAAVAEISRRPWPSNTEIRLITVQPSIEANALAGTSIPVLDELIQVQHAETVRHLEDAVAIFARNSPGLPVTFVVREGTPKEVIVDEAKCWNADLVVVGSQGKSGLMRQLLGSVSTAIAADAPCSVEIVRSP